MIKIIGANQVPEVAVQILKDSDRTIDFLSGRSDKLYTLVYHSLIVAVKIIGVQEKKYSAAGLISYGL